MMERLRPQPRRRSVSARARRLFSTAWIIASLALPALGILLVAETAPTAPDLDTVSHRVSAGENLTAIARRYGVTVDEIVRANGLNNPNVIYAGQVLVIPRQVAAAPAAAAAAPGVQQMYVIQAGDTLAIIARRYGVGIDQIVAANSLPSRDRIYAGQQIIIPGSAPAPEAPADIPAAAPPSSDAVYRLARGDSLYRISLIYGISVDDLLAANNLASPNAIYPGLEVRIPSEPLSRAAAPQGEPAEAAAASAPGSYTVQRGDTLARIAIRYGVTVDGLVAANGLTTPDRIYAGQKLNIPEGGAAARAAPARTATAHTVQRGETLSQIAIRYGVTLHSLAVANNIQNTSRIYAGMVLSIPAATAGANSVRYASVGPGLCLNASPTRTGTGYFIRPTRGYVITQQFHPWHPGIDLALGIGNAVYASDSGTVVYAGWNPVGYGNLVVLDHGNGWRTYYAHLNALYVECNEWVPRATILGEIGSTGNSTGPHLHFEMLRFGIPVNPTGYIRF